MKSKNNKADWTYIRIRQDTVYKLKLLKLKLEQALYDETLNYLLNKENLKIK